MKRHSNQDQHFYRDADKIAEGELIGTFRQQKGEPEEHER